jgi:hypothetical protein
VLIPVRCISFNAIKTGKFRRSMPCRWSRWLVMVLQVTPAEASFLAIWISLIQIVGHMLCNSVLTILYLAISDINLPPFVLGTELSIAWQRATKYAAADPIGMCRVRTGRGEVQSEEYLRHRKL